MILQVNNDEVEVTTTEEMEEVEESTTETATSTDATYDITITEEDIQSVLTDLHGIYNLFVFWFLVWFALEMLGRFKKQFIKSTDRME